MAGKRSGRTATKKGAVKRRAAKARGAKRGASASRSRATGRSRTALLLLSQVHLSASAKKRVDEILAESD
jgi:hypothetical protein